MNTLNPSLHPSLLTSEQVMELLQIKRTRLGQLIKSGGIPVPIRIGKPPQGQLRWRREEIEAWLESRREPSATPVQSA